RKPSRVTLVTPARAGRLGGASIKPAGLIVGRVDASPFSDPHRHDDVPVLVVFAFGGAELAGRLGIFEFKFHVPRANRFEEVDDVVGIKADGERISLVAGLDRIL